MEVFTLKFFQLSHMFKIVIIIFWGMKENTDQDSRNSWSRKIDFQRSNYNTVMTAQLEMCSYIARRWHRREGYLNKIPGLVRDKLRSERMLNFSPLVASRVWTLPSGDAEKLKSNKAFWEISLLSAQVYLEELGCDFDDSFTSAGIDQCVFKGALLTGLCGISGRDQLSAPRHI